ncbi:heavy-metal-associated domain-containing protein [Bordetella tumulicola]|uniref:heavy-metal-associated domain-containing protein n=1 Tax=Bordetella tumulicola TaxID=1649133 RepID=UPI0039EFCF06
MSIQFNVPDMTCGHCVSTITKAIQQAVPGANVTTDLPGHRVMVEGTSDLEVVRQAIADAGYEAQVG